MDAAAPPWVAVKAEASSAKVASGRASSWSGSQARRASPFVVGAALRPRLGLGERPPVSRRRRRQRVIVGSDTAKAAPTSARRAPRSTAASTRSRRSVEYGLTPGRVAPHQPVRKLL